VNVGDKGLGKRRQGQSKCWCECYKHSTNTPFFFILFRWVILLYHPQVILEKEKQKGSMKRKPFNRWCGQPLGFQGTPPLLLLPTTNFPLAFFTHVFRENFLSSVFTLQFSVAV
jgi:hypothetical protein